MLRAVLTVRERILPGWDVFGDFMLAEQPYLFCSRPRCGGLHVSGFL